jgi:hypothetical protein
MYFASHGSVKDKVTLEIIILKGRIMHLLTSRYGLVTKKFLSGITVNREDPASLKRSRQGFVLSTFYMETCSISFKEPKLIIHAHMHI